MVSQVLKRCLLLVTVPVCAASVWATPPEKAKEPAPRKTRSSAETRSAKQNEPLSSVATIDKIMEQAVRNIAVRYNLNEAQKKATSELMRREVHRFLKEHENEVWPVIRDLRASQFRAPSDPEAMRKTGKAAKPLAELAKQAIFRANEEWRLILTPEQQRMHDYDLHEMKKTFKTIEKNFSDWEAGRPSQGGVFPPPQVNADEPPRPGRPAAGLPDPVVAVFSPGNIFEALVEEFIKEYGLDEGQITSAQSILEEFKAKANDFRLRKKVEFAGIMAQLQEAHERRDVAAVKEATVAHKKLLEPVYQLTSQMEVRLKALLTSAQIQRHAERVVKAKKAPGAAIVAKRTSAKMDKPAANKPGPSSNQPEKGNK